MPPFLFTLVVVTVLGFIITIGYEFWVSRAPGSRWPRTTAAALLIAAVILVIHLTLDAWERVYHTSEDLKHVVESHLFTQAQNAISNIEDSPFRSLLELELDFYKKRLLDISKLELPLDQPDIFLSYWAKLIRVSKRTIDATNLIPPEEMEKYQKSKGIDVQKEAICRGVKIRRVMIYDRHTPSHLTSLIKLANEQTRVGVVVKKIARDHSALRRLTAVVPNQTEDFVIFDEKTMFLAILDPSFNIQSGRIIILGQEKKSDIKRYYDQLFETAENIDSSKSVSLKDVCQK